MVDLTDQELEQAAARGHQAFDTEPRAVHARYDAVAGSIVVDLANGCAHAFPAEQVQELRGASPESLAQVEVEGAGFNLHWPRLDVDLYVPALVSGMFGTRAWMASEFARVAGQTQSPRKAAAARANDAKGGRPRKAASAVV